MQLYYIRHAQSHNNALYVLTGSESARQADPEITATGWQQARSLADFLAVGNHTGRQTAPGTPEEAAKNASAPTGDPIPDNPNLVFDPDDLQNARGFGFTHLYCSLMVRTIQTASVVAQKLDMPLQALSDLHEGGGIFLADPDSGELVGLPGNDHSYFNTNFPELILPDFPAGGWWNRPFETREQRVQRAKRLLAELLARHGGSDDRIALVSHGGFYNYLMGAILDIPSPDQVGEENPKARTWLSLNNTAISRVDFLESEVRLVYHNRLDFLPSHLVT